jgi:hypothetical protein
MNNKYSILLEVIKYLIVECDRDISKLDPNGHTYRYNVGKRDGYRSVLLQASRLTAEELDGLLGE